MTEKLIRTVAAILSAVMLMSVVCACNKSKGGESSETELDTQYTEWEDVGDNESESSNTSDNSSIQSNASSSKNNSVSTDYDTSTKEGFIASMPEKLRGTTLTYFYWWDPYGQMEKEAIEEFTKKTGIKLKTEVGSYSNFQTELAAKIAAGNSPDMVRLLSNAMYQIKCLQPITNSGYDFSDDIWWDKLMADYTYNGKCYAVNIKPSSASILDTYVCYYNKRALKAADLQDPYTIWKNDPSKWNWSKFWSMCEEFLVANNNKTGYSGVSFGFHNLYARMHGYANYDYNSKTGKWENLMDKPGLASAWSEYLTYASKGLVSLTGSSMESGKTLFCFHGPFYARTRDENLKALRESGNLGIAPIPTDTPYEVLYEYTAFGIPQGAKNKAAVPYYLRWVLDKSSYNLNDVYYSKEAVEVMEHTLSFKDEKYFWGENSIYAMEAALIDGTADQVKTTIKSYYGVIQNSVDDSNAAIGKLPQ